MGRYKIFFKRSVRKDFIGIPKQELQLIINRIECLSEDPRPVGSDKLSGQEKYRVRQGKYRILYSIKDQELTVWVVKVGHRRNVYEK